LTADNPKLEMAKFEVGFKKCALKIKPMTQYFTIGSHFWPTIDGTSDGLEPTAGKDTIVTLNAPIHFLCRCFNGYGFFALPVWCSRHRIPLGCKVFRET
jgi:hypothetical protein